MNEGLPVIDIPAGRIRGWIVGTLAVIGWGVGCLAAAYGVSLVVQPFLVAVAAWVAGLSLDPMAFGVVLVTFFDLSPLVLWGAGFLILSLLSKGGYQRFFLGFPLGALSLLIAMTWPGLPAGLPSAALQIHQTVRAWWFLPTFLVLYLGAREVYRRVRKALR